MNTPLTLRKTPIAFIRLLFVVEFLFALLPFLATLAFRAQDEYNQTALAQSLSYSLLFTIVLTSLQILIVSLSFLGWYLSVYQIDQQAVYQKFIESRELLALADLRNIEIRQGWLGRRANYGNLRLEDSSRGPIITLKDIPGPVSIANQIERLAAASPKMVAAPVEKPLPELIAGGESQHVEFKSSILWDYRQGKMNKSLSEPILKNVAAFMNSAGGSVLVGVDDDGSILGLEADFAAMKKPNADGFELIFNNAFNRMLGVEFRQWVQLDFPEIEGQTICVIRVQPAPRPVYYNHQGREDFYIRAGNASQPLPVSKAAAYIQERFK